MEENGNKVRSENEFMGSEGGPGSWERGERPRGGNGNGRQAASQIQHAATEAASSVSDLYHVSYDFLERQVRAKPYAVLGTALGVGFVLGGGLASRLTGTLLAIGGRVLAAELFEASLEERQQDETEPSSMLGV